MAAGGRGLGALHSESPYKNYSDIEMHSGATPAQLIPTGGKVLEWTSLRALTVSITPSLANFLYSVRLSAEAWEGVL